MLDAASGPRQHRGAEAGFAYKKHRNLVPRQALTCCGRGSSVTLAVGQAGG